MTDLPELKADCARCAALCCVGLAFDKGPSFAIDKPAGSPCPNLRGHECGIHADLDKRGFPGCVAYDCQGAGQRTIALHDGASWRDDLSRLPALLDTFSGLRRLHELIGLLDTAGRLPLPDTVETERRALLRRAAASDLTTAQVHTLATGPFPGEVHGFLRGLQRFVARS